AVQALLPFPLDMPAPFAPIRERHRAPTDPGNHTRWQQAAGADRLVRHRRSGADRPPLGPPPGNRRGLGRAWLMSHKLELYNCGKVAFANEETSEKQQAAFATIYDSLRGYWQVFRNAKSSWEMPDVLTVLATRCEPVSRLSGPTL